MSLYTLDEQIAYQKNKILYHFGRLKALGLSNDAIITHLMINGDNQAAEQENEPPKQVLLEGYIKYVKVKNPNTESDLKGISMMFRKACESNSSIQLLDDLERYSLKEYEEIEQKGLFVQLTCLPCGSTFTGKPRMQILEMTVANAPVVKTLNI